MKTAISITAANDTTSEKLFDLCFIESICHGNRENIKEMVKVFIDEIPAAAADIKQAYKAGDFERVKKTAHRIKPVLGYYNIIKIEKEVEQLETLDERYLEPGEMEQKIQYVSVIINQAAAQIEKAILR